MKTLKEIVAEVEPECVRRMYEGGVMFCPGRYQYLRKYLPFREQGECCPGGLTCEECWNRKVSEVE